MQRDGVRFLSFYSDHEIYVRQPKRQTVVLQNNSQRSFGNRAGADDSRHHLLQVRNQPFEPAEIIRRQVPKTRTYALLNDLRFAVRGGRLPQWLKTMTDLMRLVPVITTKSDGRIGVGGCLIGRRNQLRKFARFIAKRFRGEAAVTVSIGQAIRPAEADQLKTELSGLLPNAVAIKMCDLGTGIGVHGGPGTLIVSIRPIALGEHVPDGVD